MSNKSKAVVAVCIIAGILGLIIFDLAMTPGKKTTAAATEPEAKDIIKIGTSEPTPDPAVATNPPPAPAPEPSPIVMPPAPSTEEYEVRQGDNIWKIAKEKLGDGGQWRKIADINPNVNPENLPVGKKILLPAKAPAPESPNKGAKEIASTENSEIYTVLSGDTLGTISTKFFKTVKYAKAIYEANKELIPSPDRLKVGMQIVIPKIKDAAAAQPAPVAEPTPAPVVLPAPEPKKAAGPRTYKVQSGDSLWKIASKYDAKHVHDMMEKIVHANNDKLESTHTPVKVGWELVIPD